MSLVNLETVLEILRMRIEDANIAVNTPMSEHTSFKIGGPADIIITPTSIEEIHHAYQALKSEGVAVTLMGNGSNMLVSDLGIRGAVIKIADTFKGIERVGDVLVVQAGALLSTLANNALSESLTGFEFASGIPGTLGGAVYMNAGAYGGEMKDVVLAVTILNRDGHILRIERDQLDFGYRTSSIKHHQQTVLTVEIGLQAGEKTEIQATMDDLNLKRTTKQPLKWPSAGSTFKRPPGYYAGQLIQDAGLRGLRYGGAQVSELHCGFIINAGQATCQDVLTLIKTVQKCVLDLSGVVLETEVLMVGEGMGLGENQCFCEGM